MMFKIRYTVYMLFVLFLTACTSFINHPDQNYTFPVDKEEGLLVMSVTMDPEVELSSLSIGIINITSSGEFNKSHFPGGVGLKRSNKLPERFGSSGGVIREDGRDDIVILGLKPGFYELSYIRLNRGNGYWLQPLLYWEKIYQFEIKDSKAVYVGNIDIAVYENKEEKKMRFEPYVTDLSHVDIPSFYETMKNIPENLVVTDIIVAKPNTR